MFLGVLPDYHNDLDITNAVSTFGHYHFWNSLDPIKSQILVLFPSHLWPWYLEMLCLRNLAELVAFANLGLLSADFTEQLPGDEDQMTPSGSPHCMPGQMQTNRNNFVLPLFVRLDGMKFHRLVIIILGTMKLVTMVTWNRTTCLLRMIKNPWCCILLETRYPL
jgi:hypothetical protein